MDDVLKLAKLELRHVLGQKKVYLLIMLLLVPVGLLMLIRQGYAPRSPDERLAAYSIFFYFLYPQSVCILAALLYASTTLSSELEGRTVTYLFTRPIPKWKILVGKYAGIGACLAGFTLVSTILGFMAAGAPGGGALLVSVVKTALLAVLVYAAIFACIGMFVIKRAMVVCLLVAVGEFILSFVPAIANLLTVSHYIRSLAYHDLKPRIEVTQIREIERLMERIIGDATPTQSYAVLLGMIALALVIGSLIIHRREYSISDQP